MTKVIPGIGKVRFPDGMTAEEIEDAIEHDILKKPRKEVKEKDEEESQEEGLQEVVLKQNHPHSRIAMRVVNNNKLD